MAGATHRGPIPPDATLIFEVVQGSVAQGLAREGSDLDLKGVLVGPRPWYLGYRGGFEQVEVSADAVYYDLRKFFRLAAAANPNILEMLWVEPEEQRFVAPAGQRLLESRERFLSRRVLGTFAGYAESQLKRIRTHRRWLLSPPSAAPLRPDFGLPERRPIPKDQLGAARSMLDEGRLEAQQLDEGFLELLDRERKYAAARQEWESYRRWLDHRNPRRAELEASFGYDTKHAMHLIRLLRMAGEILREGIVRVHRPDRKALLAIRDGALSYDDLLEQADELQASAAAAARESLLPAEPDEAALDALCTELLQEVFDDRG